MRNLTYRNYVQNAIELEYGKWFLGGEPFVWNSAIEKRLPQLERIITKKNQYYMHQLKFGKASDADSRFSVFEFRREVVNFLLDFIYPTYLLLHPPHLPRYI